MVLCVSKECVRRANALGVFCLQVADLKCILGVLIVF